MGKIKTPSLNVQRPLVAGLVRTTGGGGTSLSPGAVGISSVSLGAAANQVDITFSLSFSNNLYIAVASGTVANRIAFFSVSNPAAPGGLTGCQVFVITVDATGASVPVPDLAVTASAFSIVIVPSG
jgi:hypothetical protein